MATGKWRRRLRRVREHFWRRSPSPDRAAQPPEPLPPIVHATAPNNRPPVVQLGPNQPTYYFPPSHLQDHLAGGREPDCLPPGISLAPSALSSHAGPSNSYRSKAPPKITLPAPLSRPQQQRRYQSPASPPSPRTHISLSRVAGTGTGTGGTAIASSSQVPDDDGSPSLSRYPHQRPHQRHHQHRHHHHHKKRGRPKISYPSLPHGGPNPQSSHTSSPPTSPLASSSSRRPTDK